MTPQRRHNFIGPNLNKVPQRRHRVIVTNMNKTCDIRRQVIRPNLNKAPQSRLKSIVSLRLMRKYMKRYDKTFFISLIWL